MKISKTMFFVIAIATSLLVSSVTYADRCYDPQYNRYYYCERNDYLYPLVAGMIFSAILLNNSDDYDYDYGGGGYYYGDHGGHWGGHGGFHGGGRGWRHH